MGPSFNEQFDQLGEWRKGFANQLAQFRSWLGEHELLDAAVQEHLHRLEAQLLDDKVCVAFVAEFSRGKSELINAIFFADYKNRMLLAEANQWPEDTQLYFGDKKGDDGDECHMAFHFPLMPRMYMALAQEDRFPITDILRQTPEIPANCQWAIFLRNHDELTLEMVTDKERDYLWNYYAADRRARINLGIRRRLAPLMERVLASS